MAVRRGVMDRVVFLFNGPFKMSKCFVVLDEVGRNHLVNLSSSGFNGYLMRSECCVELA